MSTAELLREFPHLSSEVVELLVEQLDLARALGQLLCVLLSGRRVRVALGERIGELCREQVRLALQTIVFFALLVDDRCLGRKVRLNSHHL